MSSQNTLAQRQENAKNTVQQYLQEAGIDGEIAKELLVKIQNGEISVDDPVVQMLQSIADASI